MILFVEHTSIVNAFKQHYSREFVASFLFKTKVKKYFTDNGMQTFNSEKVIYANTDNTNILFSQTEIEELSNINNKLVQKTKGTWSNWHNI